MFILSVLGTTTFGLLWSIGLSQGAGLWTNLFLIMFIFSATVLFGGVPWSKFAHMFFKPAAAFNKRVIKADGSRENLPELGDLTEPGHWGDRRITRDPFRYCKIGECGDELVADTPAISARQRGIDTESGNLAKCLILRNRPGAQLRKEIA